MIQALLAGVASIKAQQTRMSVIGNNLANVNTTAFKGSRVSFQEMLSQTTRGATRPNGLNGGTNPVQNGLGVLVGGTDTNNEQGSLNATNRPTDMAIQGNGFFMVGNTNRISYTRDGGFDLDAVGQVVQRGTGELLLGWTSDSAGVLNTASAPGPLSIPMGSLNAVRATTTVNFGGNLDGNAVPADQWTTTVRIYDALGGPHDLTVRYFNRQDPPVGTPPAGAVSSWQWEAFEGATPIGDWDDAGNEPLYFDTNGVMINNTVTGGITVPASTGTGAFPIDLDFSGISQLKTEMMVQPTDQDGFPPGSLNGFSIGSDGTITGQFTNGLTRTLGQIAMTIFPNPGGMERVGNNLWRSSNNSGVPVVGTPKTGGRGSITAGFLEQSNVDIGAEFSDLIVTQRGFQANTRVVTTVDEMLQELLNMKR